MFGSRIREPARGERITADWAREIVRAVRSLRLLAGPGIRLTRTPEGTTISVPSSPVIASPRKGSGGIHYGDAEGAEKADSWSIADGTPAILDIGRAKVLVDSRGNVISWNAASGGGGGEDEPDDPEAPSAPPPCGNPLNDTEEEDYNPLNPTDDDSDDYNPLNFEGPGGYTPTCDLTPA